jgi:TatD family-associated radical SAM protein
MKGNILYRFSTPIYPGNIIYANLVRKYECPNNCRFCSRPRKGKPGTRNIYETKAGVSLYLAQSPSARAVLEKLKTTIKKGDKEIAFVGLGEPLTQFPKLITILKGIKQRWQIWTRLDTNGVLRGKHPNAAKQLKEAGLDEIRISLNTTNAQEYQKLCRSSVKNAFTHLTNFVQECVQAGIKTKVSFVIGFNHPKATQHTKEELLHFAQTLGIKPEDVIFRTYVPNI